MESRTKERLTGALILVAALVVLVPEIFSGKPRSQQAVKEPPAAAAASDGPPLRTYTSEPGAEAPPIVQAPEPAEPMPPPANPSPSPSPAPARLAPTHETPAPVPQPPAAAPRAAAPTPAEAAPATAAARANGEWFVQVGSFSQLANAQRYAQQLRGQGFESVVLPASGSKSLIRVRVGPARTREAATQLLERLAAAGHKGAVTGP